MFGLCLTVYIDPRGTERGAQMKRDSPKENEEDQRCT